MAAKKRATRRNRKRMPRHRSDRIVRTATPRPAFDRGRFTDRVSRRGDKRREDAAIESYRAAQDRYERAIREMNAAEKALDKAKDGLYAFGLDPYLVGD